MAVKRTAKKTTKRQQPIEGEASPPVRKKRAAKKASSKKAAKHVAAVVVEEETSSEAPVALPPEPPSASPVDVEPVDDGLTPLATLADSPQSIVPDEMRRVLVSIPEMLWFRLADIAAKENAEFAADEDLSVAQQAAVFIEVGVAMWERGLENCSFSECSDDCMDEPEFAEAFQAQCTGAIKRGNVHG